MQNRETRAVPSPEVVVPQKIDFGLIFFSNNETAAEQEKYRLVLDSAKFADQHGFSSIWIPERHFTQEGSLYPNPAILQAALAMQTQHIQLRAGSVVLPLHNPIRVAEEWAMIDNLSGGRVGISFASGWHPNDFVLNPDNYTQRNESMYDGIEVVRKLWRGETIRSRAGDDQMAQIRTYPSPLQRELPFWITAAGNPKTFAAAGTMGANLLTHLYNQSIEELAEKIQIYRDARAQHGYDPATGQVSVMLHTFVGPDDKTVREQLQGPFCAYLRSATHLLNAIAYSRGQKVDLDSLSAQDLDEYLLFVFERLISNQRVLFGTPESCLTLVKQLHDCGVNEIACQMDFGVPTDLVLNSLPYLTDLKEQANMLTLNQEGYPAVAEKRGYTEALPSVATQPSPHRSTQEIPSSHLERIQQRCQKYLAPGQLYQQMEQCGLQLSGTYQAISDIWYTTDEALGLINISEQEDEVSTHYQLPVALFDTCCLLLLATLPPAVRSATNVCYLPDGMGELSVYQPAPQRLWSHAQLTTSVAGADAQTLTGDVTLYTDNGTCIAKIHGIQLRRVEFITTILPATPAVVPLENLLYSLQWEEIDLSRQYEATEKPQVAPWLVFSDEQGVGTQLAARLQTRGYDCILVTKGKAFTRLNNDHYQIQANSSTDLQHLLDEQKGKRFEYIIYLWSLDAPSAEGLTANELLAHQEMNLGSALQIIQALLAQNDTHPPKLWLVTRGAQPIVAADPLPAITQASIWGLGKTCAMEHPELWGGLIDLDSQATALVSADCLLAHIYPEQQENQVAFRHSRSYVARLVRKPAPSTSPSLTIQKDASYLITGGLSGLGLATAHWLLDKGARYLVLLGRTQLQPREQWENPLARETHEAALQTLEKRNAHIHYVAVDVANTDQLQAVFADLSTQGFPPLRGVLHAASVWQDGQGQSLVRPLAMLSSRDLREVLQPKVAGSWNLVQLLKQVPLDFFVSFSSGASLLGSASQGNYAAAGEFLDILASYQRMQGQHALSVDWGAIADVGFGATAEGQHVHAYWEKRGIHRLAPHIVFTALDQLISQESSRVGVMKMDWALLMQSYPHVASLPLLSHLITAPENMLADQQNQPAVMLPGQRILVAPASQRYQLLAEYLRLQVADVLQLPPSRLDADQSLAALGLDSLMALDLKRQLEFQLSIRISVVTLLQGPSLAQLTTSILTQFAEEEQTQSSTSEGSSASNLIQQEHLLQQLGQQASQNVAELVQNLLSSTSQPSMATPQITTLEPSNQHQSQQASQLDQLTDEQIELLLQQIAEGNSHDTK